MPPKRTIQGSESPKKRIKTTDTSQTNIETFFRQRTSSQNGEGAGLSRLSSKSPSKDSKRTTRVSEIIVIDDDEDVSDASRELLPAAATAAISDKRLADEIETDRQHSVTTHPTQAFASQSSDGRQPRHEVTHRASDSIGIASSDLGLPLTTLGPLPRSDLNRTPSITNTNAHIPLAVDSDLDEKRGEGQKPAVLSYASTSQNKTTTNRAMRPIETQHGTSKSLLDVPVPVHQALQPFPDLQTDPIVFNPCPDGAPCPWWAGENDAPYALLVHALQALTSTRSRIAILSILTNVLRILIVHDPESVLPALYLLSNSLSPPWQGVELGIGGSIISKALKNTTSITSAAMSTLYKKYGDPGDVAYHAVVGEDGRARTSVLKPHRPLLIKSLYQNLRRIANAKGEGSQKTRQAIVEKLILSAVGSSWSGAKKDRQSNPNKHLIGEEPRYLIRTLVQNLRVGAVRTTILSALARAVVLSPPRSATISIPAESEVFTLDEEVLVVVRSAQESIKREEESGSTTTSPRKAKQKKSEALEDAEKRIQATLKHSDAVLRKVFAQHPSFDDIVPVLMERGIGGIAESVKLTLGIPLLPTLGSPMRALDDIYARLGPNAQWTAEMKYDGQRAQVHAWRRNGTVDIKIFSRHLEDMTDKYPDLIQLLIGIFNSDPSLNSFIVDAEVVAIDPQTGELRSFQELAGRARRDVQLGSIKVMVSLFLFDIMLLNGDILIRYPFRERRRLLRTHLPPVKSQDGDILQNHLQASLDHVDSVESEEGREAIEEFWEKAVESKCEGLMIKLLDDTEVIARDENDLMDGNEDPQLDSKGLKGVTAPKTRCKALPATYEPDKRTAAWLKLKKDYVTGVGDSLDLVPIGAWHGNGRKADWWSPILLAVYDHHRGIFVALCKCMSGFTDAFYKDLNIRYQVGSDVCSTSSLWEVETGGYQPSVYFKPSEVWEIRGADLTISPTSVTALGMVPHDQARDRGLSLRFPRFIRRREDKTVEMASTPEFVVQLWLSQENKGSTSKLNNNAYVDDDLIDFVEEEEIVEEEDSDGSISNKE